MAKLLRRPPKPEPKAYPSWAKTTRITLRLKNEDYKAISEAAKEEGVPVSTHLRRWIEQALSSEDS